MDLKAAFEKLETSRRGTTVRDVITYLGPARITRSKTGYAISLTPKQAAPAPPAEAGSG